MRSGSVSTASADTASAMPATMDARTIVQLAMPRLPIPSNRKYSIPAVQQDCGVELAQAFCQPTVWHAIRVTRHGEGNGMAGILPGAANTRILCP